MDRRSWLWRRRSSDKSPSGEAESSGSGSSHSERFSGDQALLYHNAQSPEVTSKAREEEEVTDSVSALSEKLSEALLNIQEKEDLVKQHSKVAEEAVSGWEKAETEVVAMIKQIEILTQKNSVLDEALKECLRQLRQAREEQEQKILEAVSQKSIEWESTKCELESQVVELQSQLLCNTSEASVDHDIHTKLEAFEKENTILILQINSLREELKLTTRERDLSSQAAETASKQRLDSIKKVARLEAECRRLKAAASRVTQVTDNRSGSSIYVESLTDSQSDSGDSGIHRVPSNSDSWGFASKAESDKYKKEEASVSNSMPSLEINLMDDFLEMEKLAALPQIQTAVQTDSLAQGRAISLNAELDNMIRRTAELEEKLEMVEVEKMKLEMSLNECENQLKTSKTHFERTESQLEALKTRLVVETEARKSVEATNAGLATSKEHVEEMQVHILELQTLLAITSEGKHDAEVELENTRIKLRQSMDRLEKVEVELVELRSQLTITDEAKIVAELEVEATNRKLQKSMDRLEGIERHLAELQNLLATSNESKGMAELELEATSIKLKQSTELLGDLEAYMEHMQKQLEMANERKNNVKVEIETTTKRKDIAESQLVESKVEMQKLLSKINVLEDEVQRHQALADEAVERCKNLEGEISRFKDQKSASFGQLKIINQDKELATAANKFADCQKTIASLSQQLKSLAIIEEFFID